MAAVREAQQLLDAPRQLEGRRIGVGETGGLAALADAVGRALTEAGAVVAVLHHPDESVQAGEANAFEAEVFLSLAVRSEPACAVAFFAARELATQGLTPAVVDAHEVRLKAHRPLQKSDRRDAFELCEGLRRGSYRAIVHVPPAAVLRLRATLARRRHFVRLQSAQVCARI